MPGGQCPGVGGQVETVQLMEKHQVCSKQYSEVMFDLVVLAITRNDYGHSLPTVVHAHHSRRWINGVAYCEIGFLLCEVDLRIESVRGWLLPYQEALFSVSSMVSQK